MKPRLAKNGLLTTAVAALALLMCTNPADQDVAWRTSVDLPITANKRFFLGAQLDTLFFGSKQMQRQEAGRDTLVRASTGVRDSIVVTWDTTMRLEHGYPRWDSANSVRIPDTVAFAIPLRDTAEESITEDSLEDKTYEDNFGPIPLNNAPVVSRTLPLNGIPYVAGTAAAVPAVPVTVKWVYQIRLRDTAQTLTVNVTDSTGVTFTSVQVGLSGVDTVVANNLQPNQTASLQFDARGKIIDSVVNVSLTLTPATSGTFGASDKFVVDFSLNGLKADRVVVLDSMLSSFDRVFTNKYSLTDTVDVDYIDIDKGFFIYSVTNHTGLDLLLSVTHRHLWRSDFCQGVVPPIIRMEGLVGLDAADSLDAYNGQIANREQFPAGVTNTYRKQNISANRLFPEWAPESAKSVTKVDYRVNVGVYGRRITLASSDSLVFTIKTTSFKFKELFGTTTESYYRQSEPSRIPILLPWPQSVTDSLRGKFRLAQVLAKLETRIDLPAGAFLDTIRIHYVVSNVANAAVACSSDAVLTHVTRDSLYRRPLDITRVVNDYPDSVDVRVSLVIPRSTQIKAVNDLTDPVDPDYRKYIGRMRIRGLVDYNMYAPLAWTVLDTVVMDLGGMKMDLDPVSGITDPFKRMRERTASLNIDVVNSSNVHMKLYALVATDTAGADTGRRSIVDSLVDTSLGAGYMTTNQVTALINNPGARFVSLMGNGLYIPPRDSTAAPTRNRIVLTEAELGKILSARQTGWRWQVRFLPRLNASGAIVATPDALLNTDWLQLNSWIHIDAVNSVDSLFGGF